MTPFKTTSEIWNHLFSGGKIKYVSHINPIILGFKDGVLMDFTSDFMCERFDFSCPECWLPYHEPLKLEFEAIVANLEPLRSYDGDRITITSIMPIAHEIEGKRFKITMAEIVGEG